VPVLLSISTAARPAILRSAAKALARGGETDHASKSITERKKPMVTGLFEFLLEAGLKLSIKL
jgi:hypothetical protein